MWMNCVESGTALVGLKIKVKAAVGAANLNKYHLQESGEVVAAEPGNGLVSNAIMLKRKHLTPPGSPSASKRPPRGDSPNLGATNGELVETEAKKIATNLTDLNVVKQDILKSDGVVGSVSGTEPVELRVDILGEKGNKVLTSPQDEVLVGSSATADRLHETSSVGPKANMDTVDVGDQSPSLVLELHVSSSSAPSNPTDPAEEKPKHHTIPSHAGWFSWTDIHTLEKRGLPEFFNGKVPGKTPEMYMEFRNAVMKKYREHLGKVFTVADVLELLNGVDEKSIHRIMEFLDHWGLINYHAPAEFLPPWTHHTTVLESDAALMLRALPRKGSSLYQFDTSAPVLQQNMVKLKPAKTKEAVIADMLALEGGTEVEYHCNFCSADCSKQRYHCQKQADFDLCSDCYSEGQFGPGMLATDFIKMDVTEAFNANGGGWSDQETLLLLEALELYGDNWNEIAEHVATKSKAQCILHFIRLPVEDSFSEDADGSGLTNNVPASASIPNNNSTAQSEPKEEEALEEAPKDCTANEPSTDVAVELLHEELVMPTNLAAFAEAGNPVMAQMAFLGTMVGSKMGREAAIASLGALQMKDPGIRLAAETAMILEDPVTNVQPSISENPDRSVQVDEDMQSGVETAPAGDADPSSPDGVKIPVSDSAATAQNDDGAPTQSELNLGKEVVHKTDVAEQKLNVLEEARVAGRVKQAAASALAAVAVKAKLLADQEEREMQRLIAVVIDQQLKKLELKLKFLNELDSELLKHCDAVERDRLFFFENQTRIAASHLGTSSNSNPPTSPSGQEQPARQHQHPQAPAMAQGPVSFQGHMYMHGFQGMSHPPGVSFNHQMQPNHTTDFMQSQMYQGLANTVHAGSMTVQQNHFGRHMMIGGSAPLHLLQGRQIGPHEVTPPPKFLGGL
uniref:Chromatin remodeling factor subunit n=1 Tax=Physcomitrium patens TaxID=3218 RepID=A0A7I4CT55_PHYPA